MATSTTGGSDPSNSNNDRNRERRNRVVLGELPDDFLRPSVQGSEKGLSQQELADQQLAMQLQQQQQYQWMGRLPPLYSSQGCAGLLNLTIVEASLVKNYGITRMDPYVRLRIGHCIYETHADPSAGKTPRWNKKIQCYLPLGVKSVSVEIYDECSLTMDELVAYSHIELPDALFQNHLVDEWFQLSGKQGDNKEGSIHLVLSLLPVTSPSMELQLSQLAMPQNYGGYPRGSSIMPVGSTSFSGPVMVAPTYGLPGYAPLPNYGQSAVIPSAMVPVMTIPGSTIPGSMTTGPIGPVTVAPGPAITGQVSPRLQPLNQEEMKEIQSMFPSLDPQVIQSVVEACENRREMIIDNLLQLSNP